MTPSDLTLHNETHHLYQLRFTCDLCPHPGRKRFYRDYLLDAHKVIHLNNRGPYKCLLCPPGDEQSFTEATDLDKHLGRVHAHLTKWAHGVQQEKVKFRIPGVCDNPPLVIKGLVTKFGPCRFCGVKVKGK